MKIKYNKYIVQNYFNIIHEFDVCEIRKYITDCYNFNTCACNHCKGINIIYIYSCSVRIIMENILWRLLVSRVNQMSLCLDSYFYSYLVAIFTWTQEITGESCENTAATVVNYRCTLIKHSSNKCKYCVCFSVDQLVANSRALV